MAATQRLVCRIEGNGLVINLTPRHLEMVNKGMGRTCVRGDKAIVGRGHAITTLHKGADTFNLQWVYMDKNTNETCGYAAPMQWLQGPTTRLILKTKWLDCHTVVPESTCSCGPEHNTTTLYQPQCFVDGTFGQIKHVQRPLTIGYNNQVVCFINRDLKCLAIYREYLTPPEGLVHLENPLPTPTSLSVTNYSQPSLKRVADTKSTTEQPPTKSSFVHNDELDDLIKEFDLLQIWCVCVLLLLLLDIVDKVFDLLQ